MSPVTPQSPLSHPSGPRRRPPTLRRRLLSIAGLVVSFLALLALVIWLQGSGDEAVAAPAVRILGANASVPSASPGDVITVTAGMRNDGAVLSDLTVELEVRGEDGRIALRAPRRGVRIDTARDQNVAWVWRLPNDLPPGHYRADVSVYGTNWSPLYARLEGGAEFVVVKR